MAFNNKIPATATPPEGKTGVLIANLGTPEGTDFFSVRRYLGEFLSDRRVIEAPPAIWQPILQGVVLTTRPSKSGEAYARIWNREEDASPLRVYSRAQAEKLAERLCVDVPVAWGMRYGKPSIGEAVEELMDQGCDRILYLSLYPQYSATTTATANDQLFRTLMTLRRQPAIQTIPAFPDHPVYIAGLEKSVRDHLAGLSWKPQRIVASFHGLPKLCVDKGDYYPDDCVRTIRALRDALNVSEEQMPITYQSRFGPMEWVQPYTAPFVTALPEQGITRIAVIMPGFISDCIETLDEIGHELRDEFIEAGGEELTLIPCLNDSDMAIDLLEALIREACPPAWQKSGLTSA
ncbi:ferrochelatase [Asaia bogorensis]|uniref:Ferrochelatase n=1 Tax=Asaia bogorensis NBRC 16594 TaxID=1231624 RepID=A0AAN4U248_9PROT|nr:ferrochelatase [Asaia bogorensis]BAT18713.1 ferrochelatase [Asaia bogorensis NBRC 16594]GBQ75652.1 ferrochelatase [Asaia bogorensis NBRC 16594]GEL53067.1 ferrochelatase [Asaia bogorensis NBRC 16594]